MRTSFRLTIPTLLVLFAPVGCSDDEEATPAGPGGAGGGGAGGSGAIGGGGEGNTGGVPPGDVAIEGVSAPDQESVVVTFASDVASLATVDVAITSDVVPPLVVQSKTYDPATRTLTLQTAKQKLGATYEIALVAEGQPHDGLSADFIAADTATFWASDFGSPVFADYQVTANRAAVGTRGVIYIEEGMSPSGVQGVMAEFDDLIYPIETGLFTEPPDFDENGKIVLLGLDGESYYGGYFSPVNTMTDAEAMSLWGMHSNEMELVYINVAAGYFDTHTLAHEFQHLLYQEEHPSLVGDWAYHNEGLAECAVHAVYGDNPYALQYYLFDPSGQLATGRSLVHWEYGDYDQYVLAYFFWTYVASRLQGAETYGDLFALSGEPADVDAFLQAEIGDSMLDVLLDMHVATWVQAPTGPHGFGSMVLWPAQPPPSVPFGTSVVSLEPFEGVIFTPSSDVVSYSGEQGPNVRYAGINAAGQVDYEEPFDVSGGALVALNARFDPVSDAPESSGTVLSPNKKALGARPELGAMARAYLRRSPPPVHPANFGALARWREATREP